MNDTDVTLAISQEQREEFERLARVADANYKNGVIDTLNKLKVHGAERAEIKDALFGKRITVINGKS